MRTNTENKTVPWRWDTRPELTAEELRVVAGGPIKPISPVDLLSGILGVLTG